MKIENDKVVTLHYKLNDTDGEEIERSDAAEPMRYLHGHGNIIAGLEEALTGKSTGENVRVTLPPEQAYGVHQPDAQQRIPIKYLLEKKRLSVGQIVTVKTAQGERQVQIVKVGKFNVDVDTNHPLAGMTLEFVIDIDEVRDATPEEREHGHAHG